MAQDINLLPDQTGEDKQQVHQRQLITRVSVVVLVITIVIVAGLFATNLWFQSQLDGINQNIATQTKRIDDKRDAEGIYRSLDDKLTALSTFFVSQKHYSTFLNQFAKTMPASLKLTDMSVTADNKTIISGQVPTYADLAGFYDKLRTAAPAGKGTAAYFTSPLLTTISRDDQSGTIGFSMTFTLSPQVLAGVAS
jgi:cell division protein FtsL